MIKWCNARYAITRQNHNTEVKANKNNPKNTKIGVKSKIFLWLKNSCLSKYVLKMVLHTWLTSIPITTTTHTQRGVFWCKMALGNKKHTTQESQTGKNNPKRSISREKIQDFKSLFWNKIWLFYVKKYRYLSQKCFFLP